MIWRVFEKIVNKIMSDAEYNLKNGVCPAGGAAALNFSNTSSFLTGRTVDPDGYPRYGGVNVRARSLVDILGNDKFFAWLHFEFTCLLRSLAERFGETHVEPRD